MSEGFPKELWSRAIDGSKLTFKDNKLYGDVEVKTTENYNHYSGRFDNLIAIKSPKTGKHSVFRARSGYTMSDDVGEQYDVFEPLRRDLRETGLRFLNKVKS